MENDLQLEVDAIARLNDAVKLCRRSRRQRVPRPLFERILTDEEEHVDFLEAQLHMIKEVGIENYLAAQIEGD